MTPTTSDLAWKIQKSRPVLDAIFLARAPGFVRQARPEPDGRIPVFVFHDVLPGPFEEQCRFLADNGYRALGADEFLDRESAASGERSLILTFDDGLKSLWTVAFPLLRKYRLRAVCFLIPGCVSPDDSLPVRPTLADAWDGRASIDDVTVRETGPDALVRWSEVRRMHDSGVIEFESHTTHHHLVPVSPQITDFVHPGYELYFSNIHVPVYRRSGSDLFDRPAPPGLPIYRAAPRLGATRRYFDDEGVRDACVEMARREGPGFFRERGWRRRLLALSVRAADARRTDRFETDEERDRAVTADLVASRRLIEERLPGRRVRHLGLPWYSGEAFALRAAAAAGYRAVHFGLTAPGGASAVRSVRRLDQMFIRRLPGAGRESLAALMARFAGAARPLGGAAS